VQVADVILGGAPAVRVPIQVIQSTFGGQSSSSNPCNDEVDIDPEAASFNGILGIGIFRQDCGPVCAANSNNTLYFSCTGGSCTGVAVPLADQVQQPVWVLPSGNNGMVNFTQCACHGIAVCLRISDSRNRDSRQQYPASRHPGDDHG
jgi:hypothetical protein